MGKKGTPPVSVKIVGDGPKSGLDIGVENRTAAIIGLVVILVSIGAIWLSIRQYDAPAPSYSPEPAAWPFWRVLLAVAAGAAVLAAILGMIFLAVWITLKLNAQRIENKAADNAARQIHAQGGLYPWQMSKDGGTAVNLNAAPGNRVEGLNGTPQMPLATGAEAGAVIRSSLVQIATSGGAKTAAAILDRMGNNPPERPEMPGMVTIEGEKVEELPADVRRLLEVAEGEVRLLTVEGADDHGAIDPS